MKKNYSKNQRGVVTVLVVMALPVLLLIMGLALDFGHVFVNKTRLQNALDATALSAAIAINGDIGKDSAKETRATAAGRATFNCFIGKTTGCVTPGNGELNGLEAVTLVFEYSKTLNPWGTFNPATDAFAFVKVTSTNMLNVTPVLIRIMDDMPIPARATAGAVGQNCDLVPLVICPATTLPTNGTPISGCNELGCNGLLYDTKVCLKGGTDAKKQATCQSPSLPSGEFGLLRFDGMAGGADIRALLAGTVNACANNPTWEKGNKVGPVSQGIADRFAADLVQTEYQDPFPSGGYNPQYVADTKVKLSQNPRPAGTAYNRVMAVPVVDDCDKVPLNIISASCFLMTEKATHKGTVNEIVGELTTTCPGPGAFSPINAVLNGPYKIVLFKSSGSGDS